MHWLASGAALLLAFAIIVIGACYVLNPRNTTHSFGLPLPEEGANIVWWLRLKGVRDIVSGLAVLAFLAFGAPHWVGLILLVEALIPVGDMLTILAAKGSTQRALGIHGVTAAIMLLVAIPMTVGLV
jgi:hypothetical protein